MDSGESHSSSSSSASFNGSFDDTGNEQALEECEGAQPYLFEPYDSEASSGTESSNDSEEEQFERLQNTDWYISDQLYLKFCSFPNYHTIVFMYSKYVGIKFFAMKLHLFLFRVFRAK